MALCTIAQVKSNNLKIDTTAYDSVLSALIPVATGRIASICNQPVDGATHEITFVESSQYYDLQYTVPVMLGPVTALETAGGIPVTLTDVSLLSRNENLFTLYREGGFGKYVYVTAELTIGYDGVLSPIPADLQHVCGEMVAVMFLEAGHASDARLGVETAVNNEGGVSMNIKYKDMEYSWRHRLKPYKRVV